jgi:hypothetical protein
VWLAEWNRQGTTTLVGVDGAYVEQNRLAIAESSFKAKDLSKPFDLAQQFDLVQCLEVGEHIPSEGSRTLIENLTRHGPIVLFSAAVPGQGGECHVNEQPLSHWRSLFKEFDYYPFDFVRRRISTLKSVEPWYRYNCVLYVRADKIASLPSVVAKTRVPDYMELRVFGSFGWQIRRALLRPLSVAAVTRLSMLRYRLLTAILPYIQGTK